MLHRAEECYKDSVDEDKARDDYAHMGATLMQLAVLCLMFEDPKQHAKAAQYKAQAMELLAAAKKKDPSMPPEGRGGPCT
jgi:hypothetical protein